MTRPFIGPDMTYNEQRKCRMQDAIDDYLSDEKVSPRTSGFFGDAVGISRLREPCLNWFGH